MEKCVHHDNGGTTAAYKQKIRSLFVNLKDKNNPGFRENVISGDVPVEKLAKMTSEVRDNPYYTFIIYNLTHFPLGYGFRRTKGSR